MARIAFEDGSVRNIDASGSSFEDADGVAFNFSNRTSINGNVVENTQGAASRLDDEILIRLTKPERVNVQIPSTVLFPVLQYKQIIKAAKSGERFVASDVYEGSEDGSVYAPTTALIGGIRTSTGSKDALTEAATALEGQDMTSWPVTMSYFDVGGDATGELTPNWQSSFVLYEKGVTRQFKLDYGTFTLAGKMRDLEYEEAATCN